MEREDATKEALREGRLYTGDMGKFDEDGYVYFLGRKKEMIKASGYAIAPEEVEGFMMRHPSVKQAACIPIPDPKRGESVKAFIVLNQDYVGKISEQELIDWAAGKMAAYKYPRVIEFRDDIPKSRVREDLAKDIERGGDQTRDSKTASLVVRGPSASVLSNRVGTARNSELSREAVMSEKKKVATPVRRCFSRQTGFHEKNRGPDRGRSRELRCSVHWERPFCSHRPKSPSKSAIARS